MHFHERRQAGGVTKVVTILTFGQCGASCRFNTPDHGVHFSGQFLAQEGEGQAAKVGAATRAAHEDVRRFVNLCQLKQRFLSDNRLVQQYMV